MALNAAGFFSLAFSLFLLSHILVSSASGNGDGPKPEHEKPKPLGYGPKPETFEKHGYGYNGIKPEKQGKIFPYVVGVQGLIYCKVGSKLIPLKGAMARITCLTVDKNGYESAPFSFLSRPTDAKGYFLATISPYGLQYKDASDTSSCKCKAFLEKSPWESCQIATDVNKGITGAPLSKSYRLIEKRNVRLYSVGPFFYTPASKLISNVY